MKIGVLGTGMVGRTIASHLVERGHDVRMGSRSAANEKAQAWATEHGAHASHGTFEDAARFGELIFNCTEGAHSVDAIRQAGATNVGKKILVDVANPLDFSRGMPPTLTICNTDSLAERIQRELPESRVVKALNTMNAQVMVKPRMVPGDHDLFMCGNDPAAKAAVAALLQEDFGWHTIVDLGDISAARGMEMVLPLWLRIFGVMKRPSFNFHVAHD